MYIYKHDKSQLTFNQFDQNNPHGGKVPLNSPTPIHHVHQLFQHNKSEFDVILFNFILLYMYMVSMVSKHILVI